LNLSIFSASFLDYLSFLIYTS